MEAQRNPLPRLRLESNDHVVELTTQNGELGARLTLGTDEDSNLVALGANASRHHAYIESHRNDFYLVDVSTNGTFVQMEDERVQYVHRDRVRLWGVGWISLGQPLHERHPILFHEGLS
ncbi:MAG: hypothetical protein ACI9ON_001971 [Limisphaerales bacterium]|jgi:hypothetical protein